MLRSSPLAHFALHDACSAASLDVSHLGRNCGGHERALAGSDRIVRGVTMYPGDDDELRAIFSIGPMSWAATSSSCSEAVLRLEVVAVLAHLMSGGADMRRRGLVSTTKKSRTPVGEHAPLTPVREGRRPMSTPGKQKARRTGYIICCQHPDPANECSG